MNDVIIRQFSLDIDRNAQDIAKLTKQVRKLKRRTTFLGLLCIGSIAGIIFLDKYVQGLEEKIEDHNNEI